MNNVIQDMREYADLNNVPIITDESLRYILDYIKNNNIKNILEVGTAIGYSAIAMCSVSTDISVTTIERDEKRYLEAVKNVKKAGMEDRITLIYKDAFDVELEDKFDLLFIDAAKAQNIKFFEIFQGNLTYNATVITDNMKFHGLVNENVEDIESRNVRQLVRKVRNYKEFLEENTDYKTEFLDIGDGLAVSKRKIAVSNEII